MGRLCSSKAVGGLYVWEPVHGGGRVCQKMSPAVCVCVCMVCEAVCEAVGGRCVWGLCVGAVRCPQLCVCVRLCV